MSTTEMKIKLSADARNAQAGLKATANAANDAAEEVEKLQHAADGQNLEKIMEHHRAAFEKEAAAIRETNKALRDKAKLEKELAKLEEAREKNSISSQLGGMARGALAAAPAAAAAGLGALLVESGQRAAAWEQNENRLRVSAGAGFYDVSHGVRDISQQYGTDATALLGQADRLMKAGFTSAQAVKAMESAVVAAQGDARRMEAILDELVEAGTRGYLEESLLGKMDENGVALRTALQQHLNMTKEELDSALSAGKIDVSSYFAVIDKLTGKGTDAQRAAQEAANSTAGLMNRIASAWDNCLRGAGSLLNDFIVRPLAEKVLPYMEKLAGWWQDLTRDRTEDLIAETPEGYKKLMKKEQAAAGPTPPTPEEIQAEEERLRAVEQRRDAYRGLKKAMLDAANAELWNEMTLEDKRAAIGRSTGIGTGVTLASIDDALRAEGGMRKLAAGEEISASDLEHTQMLLTQRKLLAELEKQEAAALAQREHAEEQLRLADRRAEMLKAEIDGDEERLRLLKMQEEVEKRAAQYRQMGMDAFTADERAAQDLALENQVQEVRRKATATPGGESAMKSAGWIQTSLASVGGGGVSLRQYESQGLKVARSTEKNTANIFTTAQEILQAVRNPSLQTVRAAVLG